MQCDTILLLQRVSENVVSCNIRIDLMFLQLTVMFLHLDSVAIVHQWIIKTQLLYTMGVGVDLRRLR